VSPTIFEPSKTALAVFLLGEEYMPYKTNQELPDSVKNSLPKAAQDVFRKAFNAALKEYNDEEKAVKVAWSAVKKAGFKKTDGQWTKENDIEEQPNLEELFGWNVISFEQLEAEKRAYQKAMQVEELTQAFCGMVENIMYSIEVEDKVGAINKLTDEFVMRLGELQEAEQRKAIERNEESEVELTEAELAPITELTETEAGPLRAVVRIIKPGWGNKRNNHYYPKDILKRDAYQFVGAKMYETDHNPREKNTRTWVSTIEDIMGFDDSGSPLAKVAVHDEGFASRLRNLDELGMLKKMECSIYANGLAKGGFKLNGREGKQVEAITSVSSVDWVTRAGAGGAAVSLMENGDQLEVDKENNMDKSETQVNETIPEEEQVDVQPEDVEEVDIQESDEQDVEQEEEQVQEEEPEVRFMSVAEIKEVLSETNLPKYAQIRLAHSGRFVSEEEVKEVAEAELEYIKTVTQSGKPFGNNKQAKKEPENVDKLAEAEAKKNELAANFMRVKK
jgi:cation transport regulator